MDYVILCCEKLNLLFFLNRMQSGACRTQYKVQHGVYSRVDHNICQQHKFARSNAKFGQSIQLAQPERFVLSAKMSIVYGKAVVNDIQIVSDKKEDVYDPETTLKLFAELRDYLDKFIKNFP